MDLDYIGPPVSDEEMKCLQPGRDILERHRLKFGAALHGL
jgi:hypothetical protein